jgi:hypothetical protein
MKGEKDGKSGVLSIDQVEEGTRLSCSEVNGGTD